MGRCLSEDLRVRVIRAIEGGQSRRAAAARFGVSITSAIRWMRAYLEDGRAGAKPQGGDQRSGRIEAQAGFLMQVVGEMPDMTLSELRERLIEERGETFAISTIHQFFRRHGVSYKKRARTLPSRSARTWPPAARRGSSCSPTSIRRG